jgi:hypothetical protein
MVDGLSQAEPAGPFAWRQRPRARLRRWRSDSAVSVADAEHDGYARLLDPVHHRRRVVFVKGCYWLVIDDLSGRLEHHVELRYQLAPLPVRLGVDQWARAAGADGRGLLIRVLAGVELKTELCEGSVAPMRGWVSPDYGRRIPAPALTAAATARLPLRAVTVLLPVVDASAPAPGASLLLVDGLCPSGIRLDGWGTVTWDDDSVTVEDEPA